jgi:uncharacterized protein (DUF1778 family)
MQITIMPIASRREWTYRGHMRRDIRKVRLSPDEVEKLQRAAECVGLPWSTFLRRAALAAAQCELVSPKAVLEDGCVFTLTEED